MLVSESDIPLYDPLTFYQQLMSESKSRVNACPHDRSMAYRWSHEMHVRPCGRVVGCCLL